MSMYNRTCAITLYIPINKSLVSIDVPQTLTRMDIPLTNNAVCKIMRAYNVYGVTVFVYNNNDIELHVRARIGNLTLHSGKALTFKAPKLQRQFHRAKC